MRQAYFGKYSTSRRTGVLNFSASISSALPRLSNTPLSIAAQASTGGMLRQHCRDRLCLVVTVVACGSQSAASAMAASSPLTKATATPRLDAMPATRAISPACRPLIVTRLIRWRL